jgi:transcription elongation factor Elf1
MRNELKKALKKALSHESKRVIVDSSKLESWLDKLDNTYVQSVCYLCGTEQQVSIATLVSHAHVKCEKCGKNLFLIKSRSSGHIEGLQVIRTGCPECGTEQRVRVNFPKANAGFEETTINCEKCGVKLLITDPHKYDDNGRVKGPRVVDEQSIDTCAACGTDLGTCDTIWAAEGALYCSAECGIHDYEVTHVDAEKRFYAYAEEINPQDIGINRR